MERISVIYAKSIKRIPKILIDIQFVKLNPTQNLSSHLCSRHHTEQIKNIFGNNFRYVSDKPETENTRFA